MEGKLGGKKGFTLVEMLITISIVVILSTIVMINYKPGKERLALNRSAIKLSQDFDLAREYAMSSRELSGVVPQGGYAIYIGNSISTYFLFANSNDDNQYGSGDEIISNLQFEPEIVLRQVKLSSSAGDRTILPAEGKIANIIFQPPDPSIFFVLDGVEYESAEIVICLKSNPSVTKTIKINKSGLVYAE